MVATCRLDEMRSLWCR